MTPTAVLNTHLWLVATVCAVVLVGLLTYRVTHILVSMLVDAMIQTKEADAARLSSLRRFAQLGLVGHAVQFVALVAMAGVRVLMACIRAGFFLLYALLPLMVLSCALAVLAQNWSRSIAVLTDVFNSGGLASTLRTVLLAPLTVLDYVGTYGLPIWNLAVFIFFQTPLQVLFWLLRGTGAYHLVAALLEVGRAAPALAYGIRDFAAANAGGACPSERCALSTNGATTTTTTCLQMGLSVVAEACLAPGRRDMDFVPAFAHLQRSAAHLLLGLGASCEALGVVLNVTFFPLTDPTAWAAVGSGLNAALSAGVGAPTTAVQRCGLAGGILRRPAMCMPDFGPAWDHGVRAALGVGDALTHWFDAAYLLLFDAETIERACVQNSSYVALWEDRAARALFGANTTLLVRLTQGQFALTDGLSVVYVREDPLVKTYAPQAWPFAVDARVGIARAWLPTGVQAADGGVGLFGCTCVDGGAAAGVQIRCAAVARSGLAYVLPVDFSLAAEAQLLTCDRTRLQVQSVRWPQQRPSVVALGGSLPPPCTDAATCTAADVAVWLVPVCGAQDGRKALACQSEQRFTRGICFPYCLALRLQHEGFNRPLTMRGAAEWTDGVIMAQRDCTGATAQMMPSLSTPQPQQGIRTVCTVGGDVTGAALPQQEILVAQQQQTTCAFATTCTTAVADKGTLAAYAPNSSLPALAETASEGVRLIQDGQPLVIGGGVFMRQFTPIDSRLPVGQVAPSYFDFPSLVGDDYNDYTVEVGSPDGVPAAASPVTPSARPAYVLPGAAAIDPPPENILQPSIPFNPGTLTPDGALWWASNPSYETWYAFAEYCASRGHVHETQIMLLSSYAPLRFQRARYKDACYTRAADGRRVCAADTFSAALLSQAFTLPTLTSAQVTQTTRLYDLCASGQAFDLYAEAVEWFDAANVVVAVRRGTFADLGALLLGQPPGGRTVYYFVSATDVSQAREGEPWPTTAFGAALSLVLAATSSSAENSTNDAAVVTEALLFATCPALRALPNLGAVVGHSVAGALRIGQMACGLLTNPFATIELLDAVGAGTCPDNALRHSVLANCGTALYTLEPAFAEAYAASANAWGVVAWLVAVILPPGLAPTADALGRPTTAAMLSAFLNGAAVTGEATKIVGLFNVPQALEAFDLDAQSLLEGGLSRRRALLGSRLSMLAHGGKSILGDMSSVATTGLKGFMRLGSIMLTVVQGSVFAGADLGALLATQSPPGNLAGTVVGAPSIAWAQLTYGVLSHGFVTILADLRAGHPSVAPLFMLVHDALDQFDSDVDTHHRQACAGVRLMLGYDSQLAKGLALNCLAAADLMRGTLLTASTLLVDVALFRCLCVRPGGQDYLGYVQAQCTDYIPGSRKAYWQGTLSAAVAKSGSSGGGGVPAMCRAYLDGIQTQVYGAFDPWVTNAIASVTALGSFLDEVLVPGAHPGGCSVVTTNPGAIVLTPLPITHFQVCGQTTACQALCADSIGLFQFELDRVRAGGADPNAPAATYDLSVESPFFNPYTSSAASGVTDADTLLALATLPAVNASTNCRLQCGGGSQQQCLALLTGHGLAALQVRFFCLPDPSNLLSTLFPLGLDGFTLSETDFMRAAEGYAFVHADLVWQPGGAPPYAVVYTARSVSSVALDGSVVMATAHEAFVWLPDGAGDARRVRIVGSDDLAAGMLTPQVQAGLFADQGGVLLKPQVGTVAITNLLPVDSGVPGQLVFFLAFTAQLQGLPSSSSTTTQQSSSVIGGYTLEAIVTWCDPSATMAAGCRARTDFFVPCPLACNTGLDRTCGGRCNGGLDAALSLGQQGTLLQVPAERGGGYLFLPSMQLNALASSGGSSSAMRLLALRVPQLDPYRGVTALPLSLRDAGLPISADATTLAMLGSWTRAHVFSPLLNAVQKPIRDLRTHITTAADGGGGGLEPFFQAPDGAQGPSLIGNGLSGGLAGQWLAETRPVRGPYGWQLRAFQSQTTRASANLQLNCTYLSCAGCSTARLRLLCHQAQDCALQNCVGTVVQTRSVLCGIGGVIEKTSRHAIVTWRAIHLTFGELGLLVMQGLSGDTLVHRITLRFPTDQFYTLLCEFKNTLAAVVALGVSVGNVFAAGLSAGSGAKFDLTGKQDVGALAGEGILKSTSLANLIYNVLSTGTLLPTLALHRWFLCIANASALDQTFNQGGLTIQFGDVGMDASWMACAKLEGLGTILASADAATSTSDAVTEFVQFTTTLLSGLGDTVLYGMQLSFTSTIDYMKGLVYCVQDVLYTFNLRQCKVPDYALRYVLRCACNDAPYRIPAPQRGAGWQDGALWCVGTLSMLLSDGSIGIVYNPYPLDTLAMGVAGVTDYIDCLSTHSDPGACAPPPAENTLLEVLVNQGVEPIAVWGRCKSNYALSTWDVGAGALFLVGTSSSSTTTAARAVPPEVGAQAVAWAAALSPALLDCLQDPARLQVDYAACMRLYFSVTRAQAPNAYFLYEPQQQTASSSEPPDACLVFSGLQAAASPGSPFETLMTDCGLQLDVGVPAACDLNPLIWSGNQPQKVAVAGVHGTVPPPAATLRAQAALLYAAPTAALRAAFAAFNATFANESAHIDAALFSVDGDFIHQFFDCLFLGPYTRLDLRACDAEGVLDCPYYARDELGGQSRNFTPCIGDALQGDHRLPYTCGSAARRSVIKYFYRDYSTTIGQAALGGNVSRLIRATVQAIYANYTADASRGCLDAATGRCSLAACAFETNGFTPCMDTTFQISSQRVADFIVEAILAELPQYYRLTQTSTVPWTAYSSSSNADNNTSSAAAGAFWRSDPAQAAVAASLSHFDPSATLLAYSAQEAYGMPTPQAARADPQADLAASAWSVCAALVGQLAMTLPIDPLTDLPVGVNFRQQPSQQTSTSTGLDFGDLDVVAAAVRNITQAAMRSGSPFVWHRDRRHAPSQSAVCRRDSPSLNTPHPGARLRVAAINIQTPAAAGSGSGSFTLQQNQQESFPLFGFLSRSLGDAGTQCVCALDHPTDLARCAVLPDTCATVLDLLLTTQQGCAPLVAACTTTGGGAYLRADAPGILGCLRRASQVLLLLLLFGR